MRQATYNYSGCDIRIERAEIKNEKGEAEQGWVLIISDPHEPAIHLAAFDDKVKANLVSALASGIEIARQQPRMDIPRGKR